MHRCAILAKNFSEASFLWPPWLSNVTWNGFCPLKSKAILYALYCAAKSSVLLTANPSRHSLYSSTTSYTLHVDTFPFSSR